MTKEQTNNNNRHVHAQWIEETEQAHLEACTHHATDCSLAYIHMDCIATNCNAIPKQSYTFSVKLFP